MLHRRLTALLKLLQAINKTCIGTKHGKKMFHSCYEKGRRKLCVAAEGLITAHRDIDKLMPFLHLPVQSGSDAVLHRMGRQYTIDHYLERLGGIRAAIPGIALSTDVIVGFCGETEAQFEATLALLEAVRYDQVFAAACARAAVYGVPAGPRRN